MRTILPLTCALALAISTHAQIPNGGFESWYSNVNYMEPTDWWTTNAVTYTLAQVTSCDEGTPGAVGSSYIKVTSRYVGNIVEIGRVTCGDEMTGYPGFAFTGRPATFNGQYQYFPQGNDVGQIHTALWKWNPLIPGLEVVAVATLNITTTVNGWQPFSVPFSYLSTDYPDTARVFLIASGNTPVDGSSIWVDDLSYGGANDVQEQGGIAGLRIYPSPAVDQLSISAADRITEVTVSDLSGRELYKAAPNVNSSIFEIAHLSEGVYIVHLRSANGSQAIQRFVKE
ncbi:MAG: T9SS type A sorting domain-containing protein [Flavobacteriales bacterium]|nr:T9SS type A sorting domain-containing protein [Flavobacteriales bacterium]